MQMAFMSGRETFDANFILRQLLEKYMARKKSHTLFVDAEKAFDGIPRKVILWALRRKGGIKQKYRPFQKNI